MFQIQYICYGLLVALLLSCGEQTGEQKSSVNAPQDTIRTLENQRVQLSISLFGGAYVDFTLKEKDLNPLSWEVSPDQMPPNNKEGAPFQGHFLCLGRWGSPTKGEIKAGVPHNGQASNTWWNPETHTNHHLVMQNKTPLDGMKVKRSVRLAKESPVFYVNEQITNYTSIARLNNVVQHVTIGPPFLDTTTMVNSNAGQGFMQPNALPDPSAYAYEWPDGILDTIGTPVDLTGSATTESYVTTHIFPGEYGWVTAFTPRKELLIGYLWKTKEYPWLNVWHQVKEGQPRAKGLEFGTTGIGKSYRELLQKCTAFHGRQSYELLDAKDTVNKSFVGFLTPIPEDFQGVDSIQLQQDRIVIREKQSQHTILLNMAGLQDQWTE